MRLIGGALTPSDTLEVDPQTLWNYMVQFVIQAAAKMTEETSQAKKIALIKEVLNKFRAATVSTKAGAATKRQRQKLRQR